MEFRDLKAQYNKLKPEIDAAVQEVLSDANFILGRQVTELEEQLAAFAGVKYCISCANGTDALTLALMAYNVGESDAVFVPDFTYVATAGCASIINATPVFVDIDLRTFNIDPYSLEEAIKRTINEGELTPKVIIPVDLFGLPANYTEITRIAKKYNLLVLEDGAQGFGGAINGKRACSFGDIATTSFFPAKPLGCYGDGGAIFTNDREIAARLHSLKRLGASLTDKYDNREIGMNSRLDTLQAAILQVKLKAFVDYELDAVNRFAKLYSRLLNDCEDIITPIMPDNYYSSWAQYTILLSDSEKRAQVQQWLKDNGIPSMIYYSRGLHQQTAFCNLGISDEYLPNTLQAVGRVLSLPMHPYMTESDVERIVSVIKG